jgi:hypothetical protein
MASRKKVKLPEDVGLKTKLSVLVESYNEQIEHVVKLESDLEYAQYLEIAEPRNTKHTENRRNIETALKQRVKLLDIITKRILNIDKEENGQKI